jgi:hypothetical protein
MHGMTLTEAARVMDPPIPRRELQRRLAGVQPVGKRYGYRGRTPALYPIAAIFKAHADWVRERHGMKST